MTGLPASSPDEMDSAARASVVALARSFAPGPRAYIQPGDGAYLVFSGSPIPGSNGIFSYETRPDPTELASLAATMASLVAAQKSATPWCIRLRSDPSPDVLAIAAEHGLTQTTQEPFMVRELGGGREPGASASKLDVLPCGDDGYNTFVEIVSETMGVSAEIASRAFSRSMVGAEVTSTFLGSIDGAPVATGMSLLHDGHIGIYAIATRTEHRRRGHGRAMMEHIMRHGHEAGARAAHLRSSAMGYSLYTSMGFRHAENWITLSTSP